MIRITVTVEMETESVMESVYEAEKRGLRRIGFSTKKAAETKITNGRGSSRPGRPPHNQTSQLKRFIRYEQDRKKVIIGPVLLSKRSTNVLPSLEYGGTSTGTDGQPQHIKARPFMRPAFGEVLRSELPRAFQDVLR